MEGVGLTCNDMVYCYPRVILKLFTLPKVIVIIPVSYCNNGYPPFAVQVEPLAPGEVAHMDLSTPG